MSGQMSDVIVIDGTEYAIVEPALPEDLFDPRVHGVKPVMLHTANMRGVSARYRIDDGQLLLSELQVGSVEAPPDIAGVTATTDEHGQTWTYLNVDLPIGFTGDLIIGARPILDLYVHRGFLPVWHYEQVVALDIEAGQLQGTEDRSAEVANYRAERVGPAGGDASGGSEEAAEEENTFERFVSSLKIRFGFDDGPQA